MVNEEFVDLDEIVPGTGFRKKTEEQPPKKETPKAQEQSSDIPEKSEEPEKQEPKEKTEESSDAQKSPKETKEAKESAKETKAKETKENAEQPAEKKTSNGNVKESKSKEFRSFKEEQKKPVVVLKPKQAPVKKQENTKEKEKEQKAKESAKELASKSKAKEAKKESKKAVKQAKKAERAEKKEAAKKNGNKETNWTLIALIVLAIIVLGVIAYIIFNVDFTGSEQESVVAVVNGEPIYKSELANRYNLLQYTTTSAISEEQILNLTISDKLLLQEAARRGIITSDEEVKAILEEVMAQNNISEESLKADLENKNVSYEYLLQLYKNTLTINKLINESFSNITATDEELEAFYDENLESLKVPDMVQVRHILFMFEESENTTYNSAKKVADMIKSDKSNFCELVTKYSQDTGSIEMCGEYNFSADYPFVPEFLKAGFEMTPGEIRIVKTQIGYHIMYKVANLPGYTPSLKESQSVLEPILIEEKTVKALQDMLTDLQSEAIIEIYNENISTKRFKEITANSETEEVSSTEEQTQTPEENQTAEEKVPVTEETSTETTQKTESSSQEVVVTKEIVSTPSSQKFLLAKCLTDKGARMFTESWSPDSKEQLGLFEEYASNLKIVECDPSSADANTEECNAVLKKQYPTWPTWQINGKLYEGIQSLSALSKYSGCEY